MLTSFLQPLQSVTWTFSITKPFSCSVFACVLILCYLYHNFVCALDIPVCLVFEPQLPLTLPSMLLIFIKPSLHLHISPASLRDIKHVCFMMLLWIYNKNKYYIQLKRWTGPRIILQPNKWFVHKINRTKERRRL